MGEENGLEKVEEQNFKKYWWLVLLFLFIFLAGGYWLFGNQKKASDQAVGVKESAQKEQQPAAADNEASLADQETRELRLNFKDTFVVLTGYPYVDTKYRPRLYNLIYVDTIYESDDMMNLTDTSGKWNSIYEMSRTENKIYMPIGRSADNQPIWQTLEIVKKADVDGLMTGCSKSPYALTGGLPADAYGCAITEATKTFAGSVSCFLPVDESSGLLYRQYSADGSATGDMCEVLKKNYIFSVVYKKE